MFRVLAPNLDAKVLNLTCTVCLSTRSGQLLNSVAAVVLAGPISDRLAETALDAATLMIGDAEVARISGQLERIVEATTNVFRGVSRHSSSPITTDAMKVKRDLKSRAGDFCDTLTNTSAPAALPVGSASTDFLFSCQKVVQRQRSAITDDDGQVCMFAQVGQNMKLQDGFSVGTH